MEKLLFRVLRQKRDEADSSLWQVECDNVKRIGSAMSYAWFRVMNLPWQSIWRYRVIGLDGKTYADLWWDDASSRVVENMLTTEIEAVKFACQKSRHKRRKAS